MDKAHLRRAIFKYIKRNKFIFCQFEWYNWKSEVIKQREEHKDCHLKTTAQIKKEKKLVKDYWKCGTFHYERYGLTYKALSKEEILDYVPTYYHHVRLEKDHSGIDTVHYGDKLIQARLLLDRKIPNANVLAIIQGNKSVGFADNEPFELIPFLEDYFKSHFGKLFLKPVDGQGGAGIYILKHIGNDIILNGEKIKYYNDVFSALDVNERYILQEGVIQSNQMMEINESSLNTLRVVVQKKGNAMKIKTCIIRMGRSGKEVDNSAQGGISVKVDITNGHVAAIATAEHGGGVLKAHPDSGKIFDNIVIENWNLLKDQIEAIGTKLIDLKNIALDIAVTDNGPLLLEFNFRYGIEHQQCVLGGVRKLLNIYPD